MRRQFPGDGPDHVLNEYRMIIGTHRYIPLVRPFQQRVNRARGSGLGDVDQVISPDRRGLAVPPELRACADSDIGTLVVSTVIADDLAARAHSW